jgi:hypothetical protein
VEYYRLAWDLLEPLTFLFIVLIFFMDPIRRWNFFGYRPTAVMGLFDPIQGKVILSKVNKVWSFNQGAMYESNIYTNSKDILQRELGFSNVGFKLIYTKPLGVIRIRNKFLLTRARLSTISLFSNLRGKGYMACFIRIKLENVEKELKCGAGVQETRIVDYEEAKKLILEGQTDEHTPKKQKLILGMLSDIQGYASKMKEWESTDLNGISLVPAEKPIASS